VITLGGREKRQNRSWLDGSDETIRTQLPPDSDSHPSGTNPKASGAAVHYDGKNHAEGCRLERRRRIRHRSLCQWAPGQETASTAGGEASVHCIKPDGISRGRYVGLCDVARGCGVKVDLGYPSLGSAFWPVAIRGCWLVWDCRRSGSGQPRYRWDYPLVEF